jgi:hypothetical protein
MLGLPQGPGHGPVASVEGEVGRPQRRQAHPRRSRNHRRFQRTLGEADWRGEGRTSLYPFCLLPLILAALMQAIRRSKDPFAPARRHSPDEYVSLTRARIPWVSAEEDPECLESSP